MDRTRVVGRAIVSGTAIGAIVGILFGSFVLWLMLGAVVGVLIGSVIAGTAGRGKTSRW